MCGSDTNQQTSMQQWNIYIMKEALMEDYDSFSQYTNGAALLLLSMKVLG